MNRWEKGREGDGPLPLPDELKRLMDAERLVTARLVESVQNVSRLAGMATPEIQGLFREWLSAMGAHVLEEVDGPIRRDVASWAGGLGIGEASLFSLLVQLHQKGAVRIRTVELEPGDGHDVDRCGCLEVDADLRPGEEGTL